MLQPGKCSGLGINLESGNAGSGNLCGRADLIRGHYDGGFELIEELAVIGAGKVEIGAVELAGEVTPLGGNGGEGAGFSDEVKRHGILHLGVFLFQTRQVLGLPDKQRGRAAERGVERGLLSRRAHCIDKGREGFGELLGGLLRNGRGSLDGHGSPFGIACCACCAACWPCWVAWLAACCAWLAACWAWA